MAGAAQVVDARRMRRAVVLTLDGAQGKVVVRRAGPVARLTAYCRKTTLDRALAHGASAEASVALELRARTLISVKTRLALLSNVETLVAMTHGAAPLGSRWAIVSTSRVRRVAAELDRLAAALSEPRPAAVRGIALVRMLLVDGDSPLYGSAVGSVEDLQSAIEHAVDHLRVDDASLGTWSDQPPAAEAD
jgi:hypothetical protein